MPLIDNLIRDGWLKTPIIIEAFEKIKRKDFLPEDMADLAEKNEALPIGFGQTISQPLTVAFMLELLAPDPGDKILDIGSGSGYTTALLAYIAGKDPKGKVIAIEIVPELKEFGEKNAAKYNFVKKGVAKFICGNAYKGYEKEAPFNRILVSASSESVPSAFRKQLKMGGRLVISVGSSVWLLEKKGENKFLEKEYPGFAFVPLISK